jgi:K+-transporting ATPase KdpF subunit
VSLEMLLGAVLAVALTAYLLYALFNPNQF